MFNSLKIHLRIGLLLCLYLGTSTCRKFVEIPPPKTQLVAASTFSNVTTATGALTSIYSQMMGQQFSFWVAYLAGQSSDEFTGYSTNPYFPNSLTKLNDGNDFANIWQPAYNYILQANTVIESVHINSSITSQAANQLIGEAEFIRAFMHFYLSNFYGDIPLAVTTDYTITSKLSRTPRLKVLDQVIADLSDAESKLNPNFVDGSDTTVTNQRVRPTSYAASALLARAYLYRGYYDSAVAAASMVISNTGLFNLLPSGSLNRVFLANSKEAIWQLDIPNPSGDYSTPDGDGFILVAAPNNGSTQGSLTISPQLLNAFEPNDQRRAQWVDSISFGPSSTYYFPYKYESYEASSPTEYEMVLRLAEQYLIRAEAYARLNNLPAAIADLDIIRSRANLGASPIINPANPTQSQVLSAILHERQVELFSEWGHRWFDIARTGIADSIMGSPSNVCVQKGGIWNANGYQLLFPIPLADIQLDPNLTQNPGY